MKRILFFLALFPLMLQGQVQNSKLSDRLLLEVLSGANALSGDSIKGGTPTSGVTYQMGNVGGSSDFSASGAATTANGVVFKADGDAPAEWDGAILRPIHAYAGTSPDPSYKMTNSGAIPTYGHRGNDSYYAFDGENDIMPVTGLPAFSTNDFTITAKININEFRDSPNQTTIIGGETNSFSMWVSTGGVISVIKTGVAEIGSSTEAISLNTDCYVTYKRSGTTGTFYINGVADATTITDAADYAVASTYIGSHNGSTRYLYGKLFSTEVFNYSQSDDTVAFYSNPSNHLKASDNDGSGNECTLSLTQEGMISPTLWRDYYHSIDIPISGATAPRLVKSWAGMNAWRFDGVDGYLTKTSAANGLADNVTISGWIYPTSYGEGNVGVIYTNSKIWLAVENAVYVGVKDLIFSRDNTATLAASQSNSVVLNVWSHVVITSTSTGITNIYINGVLNGTANQAGGGPVSSVNYYIGNISSNDRTFGGIIEGLKIYPYIWSSEQIALDYGVYE